MKSKNNVAVIVGGVMGALECLTLALIFLLWRRRNKAQSKEGRGVPRIPCFGRAKLRNDESMFFSGYLIPYISVGRVSQDIISLGVDPRPPSQSTLVFTQLAETYPANINSLNFSKVTVWYRASHSDRSCCLPEPCILFLCVLLSFFVYLDFCLSLWLIRACIFIGWLLTPLKGPYIVIRIA